MVIIYRLYFSVEDTISTKIKFLSQLEIQRKKGGFCVLVKNRIYLSFGQEGPGLHNVFCGLILKTGKWLQIVFFFSNMYHLDKALISLIETEFFYRGHALYLFLCRLISELVPFCY